MFSIGDDLPDHLPTPSTGSSLRPSTMRPPRSLPPRRASKRVVAAAAAAAAATPPPQRRHSQRVLGDSESNGQ